MHDRGTKDRRIQKTEQLLREALVALICEKPYEEIAVKEILGRANVGRSTFYTHFRVKDELLLRGINDMIRSARVAGGKPYTVAPYGGIVWFSLPILEHIEEHRRTGQATTGPREMRTMHEHLLQAITELIEDEVLTAASRSGSIAGKASPQLASRSVASTFVLVLNWWVECDNPFTAREADSVFRGLVEPALSVILR